MTVGFWLEETKPPTKEEDSMPTTDADIDEACFGDGALAPRGHPRFYELTKEMAKLHSKKNHDYAGDDPLSNLRACEAIGIPAWKGILVRLMDKWGRLKTFAKTGTFEVKDESVIDTLLDNAVYSLLCIIVYEEAVREEAALEEYVIDKAAGEVH